MLGESCVIIMKDDVVGRSVHESNICVTVGKFDKLYLATSRRNQQRSTASSDPMTSPPSCGPAPTGMQELSD